MQARMKVVAVCVLVLFTATQSAFAFFEDLCLPRRDAQGKLTWCLNPVCVNPPAPNTACPQQIIDFATVMPGRSMIHADSTYFIALALGYRSDVAYWIAAYNEVTDYAQYVPIDQCGVQAANHNAIKGQKTLQTAPNTGRDYITASFNGFQRTNTATDGPLDHYTVPFSPNGEGTDVHGAAGVQALYPLYYPRPGYPVHIDDVFQKTLANLRQWGMMKSSDPGFALRGWPARLHRHALPQRGHGHRRRADGPAAERTGKRHANACRSDQRCHRPEGARRRCEQCGDALSEASVMARRQDPHHGNAVEVAEAHSGPDPARAHRHLPARAAGHVIALDLLRR